MLHDIVVICQEPDCEVCWMRLFSQREQARARELLKQLMQQD